MHLLREEKEQLAKEKEELQTALNRLEESMEQQTAEEEHTQDSVKSQEEPKQTQDKVEQSQEAQAPEHEKSHEIPIQRETLHAEAEHPAGQKMMKPSRKNLIRKRNKQLHLLLSNQNSLIIQIFWKPIRR